MANVLTTQHPTGRTLEMPCNNELGVNFLVGPDTSTLGGNGGKIYQTLFVDAANWSATPDGSLARPFAQLQDAINYAVAQAWPAVELLIAPATYAAPVAVPLALSVIFRGWDETGLNPPVLGGDVTVVGGTGGALTSIGFVNCMNTMAAIQTAAPGQAMSVSFDNTYNASIIAAGDLALQYRQSTQAGQVIVPGGCGIRWDGPSWSYMMQLAPTFPATTTHNFFDAGHDVYRVALNLAGVAVDTTVFNTLTITPWLQTGDRVQVQVEDPSVQDFTVGVHGVGAPGGAVTLWVHNLTRNPGDFTDPVLLTIHHNEMVGEQNTAPLAMRATELGQSETNKIIFGTPIVPAK